MKADPLTTQISVSIDVEDREYIDRIAKSCGKSRSWFMRRLVDIKLKRNGDSMEKLEADVRALSAEFRKKKKTAEATSHV